MTCPEKWYDWVLATLHAIVTKDSETILQVLTNFGPTAPLRVIVRKLLLW